ncbi:MAG: UDP-N-acetylglucosamine 2-epimerase (non-hydrolyzing) [Nitrospirae bacterium]|nr:UDP-N-acetylglucosamine 2-epimerase (non-hydrolyzing) [Nitrospirota bacterium]
MKVLLAAGARPNFMKIAPLLHEAKHYISKADFKLVHTGQHYDYEMSKAFFDDFDISEPDYFLNVGSGSHAVQTAGVIVEFEKVCLKEKPDIVLVVGDVNSTLACSITAKKLNVKVAHIEAGLRSGDMSMPEEINRIVTDSISDYLFVTERSGVGNLRSEGKREDRIFFVGNIMIDALYYGLEKLKACAVTGEGHRWQAGKGAPRVVVTLHRPSNVDDEAKLRDILSGLRDIAKETEMYFPMHPRTRKKIEMFGLDYLIKDSGIIILQPLSYLEFLSLWKDAALVITDSGGIQEETTALGIPCFTVRDNTERPITIEEGTNILVGTTGEKMLDAFMSFKKGGRKSSKVPELWDGKTAGRIIGKLLAL